MYLIIYTMLIDTNKLLGIIFNIYTQLVVTLFDYVSYCYFECFN